MLKKPFFQVPCCDNGLGFLLLTSLLESYASKLPLQIIWAAPPANLAGLPPAGFCEVERIFFFLLFFVLPFPSRWQKAAPILSQRLSPKDASPLPLLSHVSPRGPPPSIISPVPPLLGWLLRRLLKRSLSWLPPPLASILPNLAARNRKWPSSPFFSFRSPLVRAHSNRAPVDFSSAPF